MIEGFYVLILKVRLLCVWALVWMYSTQVNLAIASDKGITAQEQHEVVNTPTTQPPPEKENTHDGKVKPTSIVDGLTEKSIEKNQDLNKPIMDASERLLAELIEMRTNIDNQLNNLIDYQNAQRENPYGPFGYYDFLKNKNIKKTENGYVYTYLTKGKNGLTSKGQLVRISLSEKLVNGKAISQTESVTFRYTDTLPLFLRDLLQDVPRGSEIKMVALAKDVYNNGALPVSIDGNTSLVYHVHIFNEV